MKQLAPIGLSVYSRVEHLKKNVAALKNNFLAPESELYIFSDAPKPGDEKKVYKVREFLKTINGFKNVTIFERKTNSRVKNNRDGIKFLLEKYGKIIFLEEDIVTSPKFLTFMNDALDFYKDDNRIFSISGYSPPIKIPKNYTKDIYLSYRFSAWGFGLWKNRYDMIDFNLDGIDDFFRNKQVLRKIIQILSNKKVQTEKQISSLLNILEQESIMPAFYYSTNILSKYLKKNPPRLDYVIGLIQKKGFFVTKTHFDPTGFKTNASKEVIEEIFLNLI